MDSSHSTVAGWPENLNSLDILHSAPSHGKGWQRFIFLDFIHPDLSGYINLVSYTFILRNLEYRINSMLNESFCII